MDEIYREYKNACARDWYQKNKESSKARMRKWYQDNKEHKKSCSQKNRELIRKVKNG